MQGRKRKVVEKYSYYEENIILRNKSTPPAPYSLISPRRPQIDPIGIHPPQDQPHQVRPPPLQLRTAIAYLPLNPVTTLKWLNHPYIVKCHRIFKTPQHLYLVYDNLPGYPLSDLLHSGCPFQRGIPLPTQFSR